MLKMVMVKLKNYRKVQELRIKKLRQVTRKTPIIAAKYMAATVRRLAPRDTGRLLSSIKRNGSTVRVSGTNPKTGFPYVHWINQTEGFKVLQAGRYTDFQGDPRVYINGNWVKVKGGSMIYGSAPSGWNWSGIPRFVDIARNSARQFFRKITLKNTRKAISLSG